MAIKNAPRVMLTINGEEVLLTNALMMEFAISALREVDAPAEVITKAEAHLTQLSKKSTAPKMESRAAKENAALAEKVLRIMPVDEPLLTSEIMERVNGIMTSQKCTKVMQVLIDAGRVERVEKAKGRYTGYKLV